MVDRYSALHLAKRRLRVVVIFKRNTLDNPILIENLGARVGQVYFLLYLAMHSDDTYLIPAKISLYQSVRGKGQIMSTQCTSGNLVSWDPYHSSSRI
jgi:hypothetical protein